MKSNKIKIQTSINVDSKKAWEYYTKPENITQWNFASPDWCCPNAENDMTIGGKYSARMEAKDGSFGFDFEAIYIQIEFGKRFSYTLEDNRKVTVSFEPIDNKTNIIIVFDAENENPIEMQKAGWQAILNNFKSYSEEKAFLKE